MTETFPVGTASVGERGSLSAAISVVVPAFNAERHLPATLHSILAQRGVTLELIVVDDCSTDGTAACVAGIAHRDPRVRYLRTASNCGGPAGPRNQGVAAATSQWIALCDADDLWHPDKLRIQHAQDAQRFIGGGGRHAQHAHARDHRRGRLDPLGEFGVA